MGTWVSFPGGKVAEVMNSWSYTSAQPYLFMAGSWIKHRHNFAYETLIPTPFSSVQSVIRFAKIDTYTIYTTQH
jgi:hypothetical protein